MNKQIILVAIGTEDLPKFPHLHSNALVFKQNMYFPNLILILRAQ